VLTIKNLSKSFQLKANKEQKKAGLSAQKLAVLQGVSLAVAQGEVVSILGPSGAGKSTFLRCVNFLEQAEQGTITLGDYTVDTAKASKADILHMRRNTAMVFQHYNLFAHKSALDNVMEGLLVRKMPKAAARERSLHYLEKVGMIEKREEYPAHLSGGQQQRVGIARALAIEPSILLLDEPTSALDPELVGEVLKVIGDLVQDHMTMLIVTHEVSFARDISDRVALFDGGNIVEMNAAEAFFSQPTQERTIRFLERYNR
jgi:L-cystine transport system ATP-binding protein